jgi:hypothetical protein
MFLVPTFCEIVKNGPYILKTVKKNLINFSVIKNGVGSYFLLNNFNKRMLVQQNNELMLR